MYFKYLSKYRPPYQGNCTKKLVLSKVYKLLLLLYPLNLLYYDDTSYCHFFAFVKIPHVGTMGTSQQVWLYRIPNYFCKKNKRR